ncbi:hypothetical protein ACFYOV_29435 [Streptomyces sp. NPDC005931]|uniref:hypothetical protein n=1 Tax=Streptomyces sp. NPDC005931 TaxID=3364737 RepID=UPI003678A9E9
MLALRLTRGSRPTVRLRRLLVAAASAGTGFLLLSALGHALGNPEASTASLLRLAWCGAPLAATVYFAVAVARTDPGTRPRPGLSAIGLGPLGLMAVSATTTALSGVLGSFLALLVFLLLRADVTGLPLGAAPPDFLAVDRPLPLPAALTLLALVPLMASGAVAVALRPREAPSGPPPAARTYGRFGAYRRTAGRETFGAYGRYGKHLEVATGRGRRRPDTARGPEIAADGLSGVPHRPGPAEQTPGASASRDPGADGRERGALAQGPADTSGQRPGHPTRRSTGTTPRPASTARTPIAFAHELAVTAPDPADGTDRQPGSGSARRPVSGSEHGRDTARGTTGTGPELTGAVRAPGVTVPGRTGAAPEPAEDTPPHTGTAPVSAGDAPEALTDLARRPADAPHSAPSGLPWGIAVLAVGLTVGAYAGRTGGAGTAPGDRPGVLLGLALAALGLALAAPGLTHLCGRLLQAVRPGALRLLAGRVLMAEATRVGRPLGVVCAVTSAAYAMSSLYGPGGTPVGPLTTLGVLVVTGCTVGTLLTAAVEAKHARADATAALLRLGAPGSTLRRAAVLRTGVLLALFGPLTLLVAELAALPPAR